MQAPCPACQFEQEIPDKQTLMDCAFCEAKLRIAKTLKGAPDLSVTKNGKTLSQIQKELLPLLQKKVGEAEKARGYLEQDYEGYKKDPKRVDSRLKEMEDDLALVTERSRELREELEYKEKTLAKLIKSG